MPVKDWECSYCGCPAYHKRTSKKGTPIYECGLCLDAIVLVLKNGTTWTKKEPHKFREKDKIFLASLRRERLKKITLGHRKGYLDDSPEDSRID